MSDKKLKVTWSVTNKSRLSGAKARLKTTFGKKSRRKAARKLRKWGKTYAKVSTRAGEVGQRMIKIHDELWSPRSFQVPTVTDLVSGTRSAPKKKTTRKKAS